MNTPDRRTFLKGAALTAALGGIATAQAQFQAEPLNFKDEHDHLNKGDRAILVAAAKAVMDLVDAAGARAGKYNVTIHGGQGIQIGDHNTQTNTF